jgi:hypothetical protein
MDGTNMDFHHSNVKLLPKEIMDPFQATVGPLEMITPHL